jgi:hypothetical protein
MTHRLFSMNHCKSRIPPMRRYFCDAASHRSLRWASVQRRRDSDHCQTSGRIELLCLLHDRSETPLHGRFRVAICRHGGDRPRELWLEPSSGNGTGSRSGFLVNKGFQYSAGRLDWGFVLKWVLRVERLSYGGTGEIVSALVIEN